MPKNLRPSQGITGNGWGEKSWADVEIAQNQYDLLKAQEEANEIEKQKMEQERINAQLQAEAIKKSAEIDRETKLQVEKDKYMYQAILQKSQQDFEEEQRKIRLCDDLGVDYNDLTSFYNLFTKAIDFKNEANKVIENTENHIEEIKNSIKKNKEDLYQYNIDNTNIEEIKVENVEDAEKELEKIYNSLESIQFGINTGETVIENNENKINEEKNIKITFFQLIVDFPLCLWLGYELLVLLTCGYEPSIWLPLIIFIGFNFICTVNLKLKIKKNIKKYNNEINETQREINKQKNEVAQKLKKFISIQQGLVTKFEDKLKQDKANVKKSYEEKEQSVLKLVNDFIDFRLNHYNEEMEMLFRKLNFSFFNIIDNEFKENNNKDIEELKVKNGTIKDYVHYIRKTIRENI